MENLFKKTKLYLNLAVGEDTRKHREILFNALDCFF